MSRKLGVIGIGNMGSMLVEELLNLGALREEDLYISNRSKEKLNKLKERYNNINLCEDNLELSKNCKNIIIAVEPLNVPQVILEIKDYLAEDSYLIISTATVSFEDIYKIHRGKITKFMPTLNSRVKSGVSLICHNELVSEEDKEFFETLMSKISYVKLVKEEDVNLTHNFTGCMPAFIAELMDKFIESAMDFSINLTRAELEDIVKKSLYGTSKLFIEKEMSLSDTIKGVSTKGGITYEGIEVFNKELPHVFKEVLEKTTEKYSTITEKASELIENIDK